MVNVSTLPPRRAEIMSLLLSYSAVVESRTIRERAGRGERRDEKRKWKKEEGVKEKGEDEKRKRKVNYEDGN